MPHERLSAESLYTNSFFVRLPGFSPAVHVDPHALSNYRLQNGELVATLDIGRVPDASWETTALRQRPDGEQLEVQVPADPNDHEGYDAAVAVARRGSAR